jgi:hypothetical protein
MSDNIDLQALWNQQQTAPLPDIQEVLTNADNLRKKTRKRLLLTNLALGLTCVYLVVIGYFYHPTVLCIAGLVLCILAMVLFMIPSSQLFQTLYQSDPTQSTAAYLQQMLQVKKKQEFLQTTMLNIYFFLLSLGLAMYMTGPASRMSLTWRIGVYGVTAAWVALNWFYLRPRRIKKQKAELDAIIDRLMAVNSQYSI